MELHERKELRLTGYDYDSPGCYFITVCTKDRHHILWEPQRLSEMRVGADAPIGPQAQTHEMCVGAACGRPQTQAPEMRVGADVLIGPQIRLSEIGKVVQKTIENMDNVEKYVIMPNHIHMILRIPQSEHGPMGASAPTKAVPMTVRYLKRTVTRECGFSIWQRSYHDHIIRNHADYLRVWEYIDTNPAKWREDRYYEEGL